VCLPIYAADNAYQDGEYFKEKDKLDEALPYYDSAEHYFPWNTNIYYGRGEVFYKKALILRGEERKNTFYFHSTKRLNPNNTAASVQKLPMLNQKYMQNLAMFLPRYKQLRKLLHTIL
jgi:tetratricopeptide (TPR) repeat protein